jgi:hypothetical protein
MQGTPQPPQFEFVLSCVSQPSLAESSFVLQSSQPALQARISQLPALQVGVAWPLLQALPQPPQLLRLFSGVSQPLFMLPSQSPQPAAQTGEQPLAVHSLSPWSLVHASPQLRQFCFVPSATSQPSAVTALQSLWPESHWSSSHTRFTHLPLPLGKEQVCPQSPQFCGSFDRFVPHLPPLGQVSSGAVQSETPQVESAQAGVPTLDVQA